MVAQVDEVKGDDVVCVVKNSATLTGSLFTLHASQIHIDLPTLSDKDKEVSCSNFRELIKLILLLRVHILKFMLHADMVMEKFLRDLGVEYVCPSIVGTWALIKVSNFLIYFIENVIGLCG